ncbi:Ltp family lipoprotein [Citricoccus alkalitolerans]|uniref:Ltp family lipoprotein n=1 Tax=Citricoccus alkalitolerans TaxID=246603 RepID=A0ABV8XVW5_9MICC
MSHAVDFQQQPQYGGQPGPPPKTGNGLGVAALVLGIIAIVIAFIPFIGIGSFLLGALAVILGIVGLRKKGLPKGTSIAGLILGALSLIIAGIMTAITATFVAAVDESLQSMPDSSIVAEATTTDAPVATPISEASESTSSAEDPTSEAADPEVPTEHRSALAQAQNYSDLMYLSKAGLWDQLTSEYGGQFTEEAADYAVENVEADWQQNALEQGRSYQETMSMSPAAVYDQLVSEYGGQFTAEEAQYAVDNL